MAKASFLFLMTTKVKNNPLEKPISIWHSKIFPWRVMIIEAFIWNETLFFEVSNEEINDKICIDKETKA